MPRLRHQKHGKLSGQFIGESWLLIFDNVDNFQDIDLFLPKNYSGNSSHGQRSIIITMQRQNLEHDDSHNIWISALGTDDGLHMLTEYLGSHEAAAMQTFSLREVDARLGAFRCSTLLLLPLSKKLVAVLQMFLTPLGESHLQWMNQATAVSLRYGRPPETLFDSALAKVQSREALQMICLLALLDGNGIPDSILYTSHEDPSLEYLTPRKASK